MKRFVLLGVICFFMGLAAAVHAADAPRHRFTVTSFRAVELSGETAASAMKALSARLAGKGTVEVKERAEACVDAPCARRAAALDGSHRAVMGTVNRSARRIMKDAAVRNKTVVADAFTVSIRVVNGATGAVEYATVEGAVSENDLPRAAGRIADRILARYSRIPVPVDAIVDPVREKTMEAAMISASRMAVGISGMAMRMEGSFGRYADYGFGAKADIQYGDRSIGGPRLLASLGALSETGLMESVESSRMGFLHLGAGWQLQFARSFGMMPYAAAGYVAHMVTGTTAADPGGAAEARFYFDPAVTAGVTATFRVLRPLCLTLGISYNAFFEQDATGRFAAVTAGFLFEL